MVLRFSIKVAFLLKGTILTNVIDSTAAFSSVQFPQLVARELVAHCYLLAHCPGHWRLVFVSVIQCGKFLQQRAKHVIT